MSHAGPIRAALFAQQMEHDAASMGSRSVLENVNPLPCSQRQTALLDRNRNLRQSESRPDMCRHVIGTFDGVAIQPRIFRYQAPEERIEIVYHVRIGILLNGERCRRMLQENGEQASADILGRQPLCNRTGDIVQTLPARGNSPPADDGENCRRGELLDRHTLGQVTRLIHVAPAANRDVIRQQLQGNDFQ